MKEMKAGSGYNRDVWFWVEEMPFDGERQTDQCRRHVKKAVGRGDDGKLFLMVWTDHDPSDWRKFTQTFYEIDADEYAALLDRAIANGKVRPEQREGLLQKANSPFVPPWNIHKAVVVYRDERYILGQQDDCPYLIADGKHLRLTCHPYEPCLYITDGNGFQTAVHNAFDPFGVLESFSSGKTVTSITGLEYDARDFCRMVEAAAGRVDISIDEAERVFGGRKKEKRSGQTVPAVETAPAEKEAAPDPAAGRQEGGCFPDDPFYACLAEYPGCAVDYRIFRDGLPYAGYHSHRTALAFTCRELFDTGDEETAWQYDLGKAGAKKISAQELFAPAAQNGPLNYRRAFLYPPHGSGCTGADFDRVNALLFPNGTQGLEVYEWTTDWSEYFDDGHEWWGALCLTVYDKSLRRFVVILASATD